MASTYLSRTPSSTGNQQIFTFSAWVKRASLSSGYIFSQGYDGNNNNILYFKSGGQLSTWNYQSGFQYLVSTEAVYRDTSGWYHVVVSVDTTQATSSNRVKLYVNGEQITSFSENTEPSQNTNLIINGTDSFKVGSYWNATSPFDGSMSHVHFIDGTAYDASAFGETDATTGEWKIKTSPSVTYGNNGFFILKDGNSVTDQSGNSNNFTVGGGTLTKTEDCPSNVFATWNSLVGSNAGGSTVYYPTLENGNTKATPGNSAQNAIAASTLGASSGKWYAEFVLVSESDSGAASFIGVTDNLSAFQTENIQTSSQVLYGDNGTVYSRNSSTPATGTSFSTGDVVGVALDLDNNYIYFSVNGTFVSSGDPTSGSSGTGGYTLGSGTNDYFFMIGDSRDGNTSVFTANFGNGYQGTTAVSSAGTNASGIGIFEYDVPTGYTALSTKGLNL